MTIHLDSDPSDIDALPSLPALSMDRLGQDQVHILFGKHKGKPWTEVPNGYLTWISEKCVPGEMTARAGREVERRAATAPGRLGRALAKNRLRTKEHGR